MQRSLQASLNRNARFLASLVPAALLFVGFFAVVGIVRSRLEGGIGIAVGILAAGCLALGILLSYLNLVDWLNLRVIQRALDRRGSDLPDGAVLAFDGFVRTDGDPMISPFSGVPCAAYAYVVAYSRQSSSRGVRERIVLAQGFHMMRTRIEGAARSLELRSFPELEDALRENADGVKWGEKARALVSALSGKTPSAGERERQSRLLEVRHTPTEEVHHDYLMGEIGPNADALAIDEEVLPAGQAVTVIGTYHRKEQSLTARRSRLGANLFVYRGRAQEVQARVGKEIRSFAKAAVWLLAIGGLLLAIALSPAPIASKLPLIGPAVILRP